jgi:hypothetical protein
MNENYGNNLLLFVLVFFFCLILTLAMYIGLTPEEFQTSKMIIFSHPENAS